MPARVLHLAHLRWFTEGLHVTSRPLTLAQGSVALAIVAAGFFVASRLARVTRPIEERLDRALMTYVPWVRTVVGVAMGLGLIMACRAGDIVTPEHHAVNALWLFVELYAGVSWVMGFLTPVGSLLAVSLYVPLVAHSGPLAVLEHMELLGAAVFLGFGGRGAWSFDGLLEFTRRGFATQAEWPGRMFEFLTGMSLVVVGLTEKLLDLGMAEAFLTKYPWNFLAPYGLSNDWFITLIGASEVLIGLLIACNVQSRLTVAAVLGMMVMTAILLGPMEVAGHLFAAGLVACVWLRPRYVALQAAQAAAPEVAPALEGAA